MSELEIAMQEKADHVSHLSNAEVMVKDGLQELFNIGMQPALIMGFVARCFNEICH